MFFFSRFLEMFVFDRSLDVQLGRKFSRANYSFWFSNRTRKIDSHKFTFFSFSNETNNKLNQSNFLFAQVSETFCNIYQVRFCKTQLNIPSMNQQNKGPNDLTSFWVRSKVKTECMRVTAWLVHWSSDICCLIVVKRLMVRFVGRGKCFIGNDEEVRCWATMIQLWIVFLDIMMHHWRKKMGGNCSHLQLIGFVRHGQ